MPPLKMLFNGMKELRNNSSVAFASRKSFDDVVNDPATETL
jgi:hypothetical protein